MQGYTALHKFAGVIVEVAWNISIYKNFYFYYNTRKAILNFLKIQDTGVCVTCWRRACACALVIALVVGTNCLWKSSPFIWIPGDKNTNHEAHSCPYAMLIHVFVEI